MIDLKTDATANLGSTIRFLVSSTDRRLVKHRINGANGTRNVTSSSKGSRDL